MSERMTLIARTGDDETVHELPDGGTWQVRIGRGSTCDISVDHVDVDPEHCLAWAQDDKVFVEDLGSRAGTFVNDSAIEFPARLRAGMAFRVGSTFFELKISAEAAPAVPEPSCDGDRAAQQPVLTDQTVVFQALQDDTETTAPRPRAVRRVALSGEHVELGRDVDGPGRIEDVLISRRHAELRKQDNAWGIRDIGSTNGTFVNGERLDRWRTLQPNDVVSLGSVLLRYTGRSLRPIDSDDGIRVDVLQLTKTVRHRDTGKPLTLLDAINVSVLPGEFVAMLGSSGCGKSTFMDAINGRRRATEGQVLFNGRNLYEEFPSLKCRIGYVPQEVILHRELPVEDALRHASRLRLPTDTTTSEIESGISTVLKKVGLAERRGTPINALSGGQQKRVSIAMELLSRPSVLFLDEVTSGLDMKTEKDMMKLFRELADDGITIFCITHCLDSLAYCHHVAYFFDGKIAFFGPEHAFRDYFDIKSNTEVFTLEENADAAQWCIRYEQSPVARKLLHARLDGIPHAGNQDQPVAVSPTAGAERSRLSAERLGVQTSALARRYVKLLLSDRLTLGVIIALSPITAGLIAVASEDWLITGGFQARTVAFMAIVTSFFLGLFTSAREIVKELPVYIHERMIGVEIVPYLVSKAVPLGVINVIQVTCLILILRKATEFAEVGSAIQAFAVLLPVAMAGTLLGLVISAWVHRIDTAVSLMIFAIVPQLLFAGNFAPLDGARRTSATALITSYNAFDAMENMIVNPTATTPPGQPGARRGRYTPPPTPAPPQATSWVPQVLVIWGQCAVLAIVTFFLLLRRDGPGSINRFLSGAGRIIQAQTTDERVNLKEWFTGAGAGLRKG
ncbi:MAG: FHA domain-containing protein [Planctomycetes bacterium]|nr:FHA domain-containing protein [Planctomycetota bacterium]NOG53164.1 FHA domain-containing protein [Planctomycetota bacterium]